MFNWVEIANQNSIKIFAYHIIYLGKEGVTNGKVTVVCDGRRLI